MDGRPAGLSRAGAAIATLAAAALLLALGLGPAVAQLSPANGLPLAKRDSELQRVAALSALGEGRTGAAQYHARLSLAAMPWNQSSVTVIGQSLAGKPALDALNLSAALGWRDPLTNARLFDAAIAERQPVIAAERVDALGRTVGFEVAGAMADRLLSVPGGGEALAERAAHHLPPADWVPRYLRTPPASTESASQRADFIARISTDDGTWRRMALASAMTGFGQARLPEAAYRLWRQTLADQRLQAGPIYDARFTTLGTPNPLGGEWGLSPNARATADRLDGGGLTISASGSEPGPVLGAMTDVGQLSAGFAAVWQGEETAIRHFALQMSCAQGGSVPLVRSLARVGEVWIDQYRPATPAGCAVGYLALALVQRPQGDVAVKLLELRAPGSAALP